MLAVYRNTRKRSPNKMKHLKWKWTTTIQNATIHDQKIITLNLTDKSLMLVLIVHNITAKSKMFDVYSLHISFFEKKEKEEKI